SASGFPHTSIRVRSNSSPSCRRRQPANSTARCCVIARPQRALQARHEAAMTETQFPKITEQALDDLRRRIGVPIKDTLEPWCHEATRDNIRHYAHGIGDDNPLWCDPEYGAKARYGTIVAPPSFLFACDR